MKSPGNVRRLPLKPTPMYTSPGEWRAKLKLHLLGYCSIGTVEGGCPQRSVSGAQREGGSGIEEGDSGVEEGGSGGSGVNEGAFSTCWAEGDWI